MTNVWVTMTVRFAAVAPDDGLAADDWADSLGDKVAAAIPPLDDCILDGSMSIVDWKSEVVA